MSGDKPLMRADGMASIGVGLFGVLITLVPFRRRERWAWWVLWFYPAFWLVHLVGDCRRGTTLSTRWCSLRCRSPVCCCPPVSSFVPT
jgi:hypothetical protein